MKDFIQNQKLGSITNFFSTYKKELVIVLVIIIAYSVILWIFSTLGEREFSRWYERYFAITTIIVLIGSIAYASNYNNTTKFLSNLCFISAGIFMIVAIADFDFRTVKKQKNDDGTITEVIPVSAKEMEKIRIPKGMGIVIELHNVDIETQSGITKKFGSEPRHEEGIFSTGDKYFKAKSHTPTDTCYVAVTYNPKRNSQGYDWSYD